jgi:hypothetical protein
LLVCADADGSNGYRVRLVTSQGARRLTDEEAMMTNPKSGPAWGQPGAPGGWVERTPLARHPVVAAIGRAGGLVVAAIGALWVLVGADMARGGSWGLAFLSLVSLAPPRGACEGCGLELAPQQTALILGLAVIELIAGLAAAFGKGWGRVVSIIYSVVFGIVVFVSWMTAQMPYTKGLEGAAAVDGAFLFSYAFAAIILIAAWRGPAMRPGRS